MTLGVRPGDRWKVARQKAAADQAEAARIERDAQYWKAVGVQGRVGEPGTPGEPGPVGLQGPQGEPGEPGEAAAAPIMVMTEILYGRNNLISGAIAHYSDGSTQVREIQRGNNGRPVAITTVEVTDDTSGEPMSANA